MSAQIRMSFRRAAIVAMVSLPTFAVADEFKLVVLPLSGGAASRAYGLNNSGQLVGWVNTGSTHHAAQWNSDIATDLHTGVHFALAQVFNKDYSEAYDISDDDQVVGAARREIKCGSELITLSQAYVMRPATLSDLATPFAGDALTNFGTFGDPCSVFDSAAIAISNRSHIVGWSDVGGGTVHAFIVRPTNGAWYADFNADSVNDYMIDLKTLDNRSTFSSATAVNDSGQVTGYSYTTSFTYNGDSAYHAFLVTPQNGQWYVDANADGINDLMLSLGTLGGPNSWGRAINNSGIVVGEADTATYQTHAFIYQNGLIADLGTLGGRNSSAASVNKNGDVVGWAENAAGQRRAFLYRGGKMYDLNTQVLVTDTGKMTLTEARAINDQGDIVGFGTAASGTDVIEVAFRLRTPTSDELDAAQALLDAQAGIVDGATADSNGNQTNGSNSGGGNGITIVGAPGSVGTPTSTGNTDNSTTDNAVSNATAGLCGAGVVGMMPLTMLAMLAMRRRS